MPRSRRDPPLVTVRANPGDHMTTGPLSGMFPGVTHEPLYDGAQQDVLDALISRAQQLTPAYQPARFGSMFRVQLPPRAQWTPGAPTRNLAIQLQRIMLARLPVDHASVETVVSQLPLTDGTATADLQHLDAAPIGLGVEAVWSEPGGRGKGEVLADVERGWHTDHVEFTDIAFTQLPDGLPEELEVPHGTQVLAVAVARENDQYGLGVAPGVSTVVLSAEKRKDTDTHDTAAAILDAIDELANHPTGSVLLLEVQKEANDFEPSVKATVEGPCEMALEIFELIQLAVANHIVVVEAAGNGGASVGEGLDLDAHPDLLYGDSGAILVGQSLWTSAGGHEAMPYGCTGQRIDCFSWGFDVYAASALKTGVNEITGETEYKDEYTSGFGGTSAASAIIAGAALVVQGLVRNGAAGALGYLTPMQMRSLLGDRALGINTPLADGVTDSIGVQPHLKHIASELGVLPDLYIRDNVGDVGGPHDGMLSQSPDIIVRASSLVSDTPDEAFGEGSGEENADDLSEDPVEGETTAVVYARVRNRGGGDVVGAEVKTYYATSSTLVEPGSWQPIGATFVDVPQGNTIVVAGPIPWTTVPLAGHYCLIATVEHATDPLFVPAAFADLDAYKSHVRLENNVAWRNINVVSVDGSGMATLITTITGAAQGEAQQEEPMELRIETQLPQGAGLELELPQELLGRMSLPEGAFRHGKATALATAGVTHLGVARLRTREAHQVTLHARLPKGRKQDSARYEVSLIQLHRGQPVGRVTWWLVAPAAEQA